MVVFLPLIYDQYNNSNVTGMQEVIIPKITLYSSFTNGDLYLKTQLAFCVLTFVFYLSYWASTDLKT